MKFKIKRTRDREGNKSIILNGEVYNFNKLQVNVPYKALQDVFEKGLKEDTGLDFHISGYYLFNDCYPTVYIVLGNSGLRVDNLHLAILKDWDNFWENSLEDKKLQEYLFDLKDKLIKWSNCLPETRTVEFEI